MASSSFEDLVCTCEPGQVLQKQLNPDCPRHGKRYVLNPKLATNSWLQPYLVQQS
jgi:hypothetical protein